MDLPPTILMWTLRRTQMLNFDHWHLEISSICALKCPRCPRLEVPNSLLNQQLDLDFFQDNIGISAINQAKKITFCGNDGDPIYCRDLVAICQWIKLHNPGVQLVIITNGSGRPQSWWKELAATLDKQDQLHWSLDGWDQDSNEQYRVNSDWSSIMVGIKEFFAANRDTYRVWASIAFSFNEWHVDHQKDLAQKLGFDLFQLTKSTKFGSRYPDAYGFRDSLEPVQKHLVSATDRFERILLPISARTQPGHELKEIFWQRAQNLHKHNAYSGVCLIGNKGIFINSSGEFYPCCWTANRYSHNQDWHQRARTSFNLKQRTFKDIVTDTFWHTDFLDFDSQECRTKCTPDRLQDRAHVTEW
jgi:MoaA/NifB/PqqE/SkfB family radical SAM enzyme